MAGAKHPGPADMRRAIVVVGVIAVHGLLAVVAVTQPPRRIDVSRAPALTVRAIPDPPRVVVAVPDAPLGSGPAEPVVDVAPAVASAAPPCDVAERIGAAVAADPAAIDALGPVAASATPAIMLWDGRWSSLPAAQPARRAAVVALTGADRRCRNEVLTGPRLIFVSVSTSRVSIAVGSGTWRWQALLENGPPSSDSKAGGIVADR